MLEEVSSEDADLLLGGELAAFLSGHGVLGDSLSSEGRLSDSDWSTTRTPVVGRKNWMFAGSEGGAHSAAIHFSIVLSCELAGIDLMAYLRDVLGLLPDAKPSEVRALTPLRWAARFGETGV